LLKKFFRDRGARKNIFRKAIDQNWKCHMVFTPLASLPSGNDLKRISKNVGRKAETSRVITGSQ
jgi:hypothetical protein